jgi:hypothetical protein
VAVPLPVVITTPPPQVVPGASLNYGFKPLALEALDGLKTRVAGGWACPQANYGKVREAGGIDRLNREEVVDPVGSGTTLRHEVVNELMTRSYGIARNDRRVRGGHVREVAGFHRRVSRDHESGGFVCMRPSPVKRCRGIASSLRNVGCPSKLTAVMLFSSGWC